MNTLHEKAGTYGIPYVRTAVTGMVAGMIAAMGMAMYAMIASISYHQVGFFTPLYHIASTFTSPTAMTTSMQQAAAGHNFTFNAGPAVVGMIVHLATGAGAGAVFAVIAALLRGRLGRVVTVAAGMAYGLVVMVVNAVAGLPLAASLFGAGDRIATMPSLVGWWTFTIEHLIFGMVLAVAMLAGTRTGKATDRNPRPTPARTA